MDWFAAVMALVGVLVGVGVQELRIWREKKDKYKDMVFKKRLDAHQGAYYRCKRLGVVMLPHRLVEDGGTKEALAQVRELSVWEDSHMLYLAYDSRVKIGVFLKYSIDTVRKYRNEEWVKAINVREEMGELRKRVTEVLRGIERGVGANYLPEGTVFVGGDLAEEMFDEAVVKGEELVKRYEKKEEKMG